MIEKPKCPICGKEGSFNMRTEQWYCNRHPSKVIIDSRDYYKRKCEANKMDKITTSGTSGSGYSNWNTTVRSTPHVTYCNELDKYTTEELLDEIKRRLKE